MAEEYCCGIGVGDTVPDFKIKTYDPVGGKFGEFSLKGQLTNRKWTILFFYPADFTFV